ncbi:MAG: type III-B CRISPR module RAMP protein Cmr1, partial [Euryarchaeota archaeon]|nr:type III-B CRISPR module RAMP protein Cmr1 [Euryarchaeota archaeon]
MEVRIRTLTPLWTGDVDRKCRRIRETGIIGSLRWWYEALVRGLGGYACDPTSVDRCELNQKRFQRAIKDNRSIQEALDEQICPACQLFGCTGWSRRFKVEMENLPLVNLKFVTKINHLSFKTNLGWWINKTLGKNP